MKWYTCTPVPFKGDHTFFCRDSGAFCKAFRQLGMESKAIMPTPAQEGDDADLIRTDYANLEDPEWWKSLGIDGLVLYSWGMGKYTPVARAVRRAGIRLVVFMDSAGLFYPWSYWKTLTGHLWMMERTRHGRLKGTVRAALRIIKAHTAGALNLGCRRHLKMADLVTFPIPLALDSIRKRQWLYGKHICDRLALIPTPISARPAWTPASPKRDLILAVGRWDDRLQKNPELLMETLEIITRRHTGWNIDIYGNIPPFMRAWHESLPSDQQAAIRLAGPVPNEELQKSYAEAKICLCTSRYESSHIVSAEALCAGASVVGPQLIPMLSCISWYISHDSGTVSPGNTPESLAEALLEEINCWKTGKRDPQEISRYWSGQLHATHSCRRILDACEGSRGQR